VTHGFPVGPPILGLAWTQNQHRLLGGGNAASRAFPATTGLGFAGFFLPLFQPTLGTGHDPAIR